MTFLGRKLNGNFQGDLVTDQLYFMDRQLDLIHVKLQSWFPFPIQVYVNGHEWLARRLDRHGLKYLKSDNVFLQVSDLVRAQRLADGFASLDWVRVLGSTRQPIGTLRCQGDDDRAVQPAFSSATSD
jgi:hypothetical protein